jgi:hypothetical protein
MVAPRTGGDEHVTDVRQANSTQRAWRIHFDHMARAWAWSVMGATLAVIGLVLIGAYTGLFGGLVVCGADKVAVCVAWPGVVSAAVWALYILFFVGVAVWQIMMWRHEPIPAPPDDEGFETYR